MKPENTPENKARFFAIYWNQHVLSWAENTGKLKPVRSGYINDTGTYLELKPLSEISEEDAFTIASIFHPDGDFAIEFNSSGITSVSPYGLPCYSDTIDINWSGEVSYERSSGTTKLQAYDYLRSKGYALPYMGLSVDELIKYGWVKLKE